MTTQTNGPRDIVEGGPERPPDGQDERDKTGKQADAPPERESEHKDPHHGGDVPIWYQPESGQLGFD